MCFLKSRLPSLMLLNLLSLRLILQFSVYYFAAINCLMLCFDVYSYAVAIVRVQELYGLTFHSSLLPLNCVLRRRSRGSAT